MANFSLLDLFGLGPNRQTPAVDTGTPGLGNFGDEIVVNGQRQTNAPIEPVAATMPDTPLKELIIPKVARTAPTEEDMKEIIPRKGMFGIKGNLRNILGVLGDAFLVQSGNKPVYGPRRAQERASDALYGFTQDQPAAAERLAAAGYPDAAAELYKQYQTNDYKQNMLESLQANRESQIRTRDAASMMKIRDLMTRMANAGQDRETLELMARALGVDPVDVLPDQLDTTFSTSGMTVAQQRDEPRKDARIQQGQRRVDIAQQNADRPRQGRAPRAENRDERYIRLSNEDPNTLSAGERAWLANENSKGKKSRGRLPGNTGRAQPSSKYKGFTVKRID